MSDFLHSAQMFAAGIIRRWYFWAFALLLDPIDVYNNYLRDPGGRTYEVPDALAWFVLIALLFWTALLTFHELKQTVPDYGKRILSPMRVTGINKRIVLLPNATWYILSQARKGKDPRWATLDYETYPQQYSWLATLLLQMIREGHVEVYAKFTESPFYEKSDLTGRTYYIDFENSSYVRFSSDLDDILNDEDQIRDLDELALPLASVKKLARQFRNGEIADHPVYDSNGFASIVSGEFLKSTPKHV